MMVALEGQHTGLDTNEFWNCMPWVFNNARVLGMYFRSSLRMSSVRMMTKLGWPAVVWASVGGLPVIAEMNSTAKAADANSRTVLLILHLSLAGLRKRVKSPPP